MAVTLIRSDLEFILQQIAIAEAHAAGADLLSLLPNELAMLGLRTVDGSYNNVIPGQEPFGAADQDFPVLLDPQFRDDQDGDTFDVNGPGPGGEITNTNYASTTDVVDADPRLISNLVVDQTITNPAAVAAYVAAGLGTLDVNGVLLDLNGNSIPAGQPLFIPNTTPDAGLSAPFNSWFTLFGQFFDHGLDLVNKGGNGTVFIPLAADDPLLTHGLDGIAGNGDEVAPENAFMVLTRTTNTSVAPGADNILGTADDIHTQNNQTTPFVDQNQTYTSHPSHQVFLREYALDGDGDPVATGRMLDGADGGLPTWADVKAQAANLLGIALSDADVTNLPMLRTDPYGNFIPGANGFAQIITGAGTDGLLNTSDDVVVEGDPLAPIDSFAVGAVRTDHAFLDDIAHSAAPRFSSGPLAGQMKAEDADVVIGDDGNPNTYDDELLDRHFITGDGRGNENIGLTSVHHVFHSEHNRQVDAIIATVLASGDAAFIAQWQFPDGSWNGERLFQAAKFTTEMQYQHLVFEEFARKVQPNVDAFLMYDAEINPAIVAEFAHVVYRFGHSMLTETVDRFDPNFVSSEIGLIEAFLNPVAFNNDGALTAAQAAGAVVRGMTRQGANEIDEFVTEALRNNLLGLPLDLPTINLARGRDTGVPSLNAARRDFYEHTGDGQLRPYTSWVDFSAHLKHPESVVNFIAAYGIHSSIAAATTIADKRAAAMELVFGIDQDGDLAVPADRLDFLNSTGAYASLANGVTTTGVDDIDLWIGGLAEKQMPFGGLLGSTFNFVFETQLEALQNHDRFYYLGRLAGLNFLTELENNSFAKLIMANTDVTRLPADVFSNPTWILEVDPTRQFNDTDGDLVLDNLDPVGGTELRPLVIRDNPATPGPDTNYLEYTGPDHVVLGGTSGNDIIISSEGDDTLWGDGGNDRLEGGDGVDTIEGGDGDDIITDKGGDDVLKGNDGNDVIHGGNGFNLIIGGSGKDFIITGEDVSDTFGGQGDDFILGSKTNLPSMGNEGNDWIEIGTQDGAPGDNFNLLNLDDVPGHDIFIGGGGFDEMLGEGGDDVFVGSEGEDHFDGDSGFDWTTYKNDTLGVTVDLLVSDLVEPPATPSNAGILDRFAFVEGLSGSSFADVLRGDDADATEIAQAGALGSVLTQEGIDLVSGLQTVLGEGVTTFGAGNIILGGSGSDIIEGRAGNDIIDGDRWLNVRISVRENADGTGAEIRSVDSMQELVLDMLAGTINPGQLVAVREILNGSEDFDTAVFSGNIGDYTISTSADGTTVVTDTRVIGPGVAITDGIDTLRGIERLQFADTALVLPNGVGLNNGPVGQLSISDTTPSVNQLLTVSSAGVTDADNPGGTITGPVTYLWQVERNPGTGVFEDIVLDVGGSPSLAHGASFRVTADLDGLALRARAIYKDADGTLENVYSNATGVVAGTIAVPTTPTPPAESPTVSPGNGVHFIRSDLSFILEQIKISEANSNAYGSPAQPLTDLLPNSRVAFGLRTVDGSFNNLIPGQTEFGAADNNFPLQLGQVFRNELDGETFDANGPAPGGLITNTNYATTGPGANVVDGDLRVISNLIVDQTASNPAAVAANGGADPVFSPGMDGIFGTADDREVFLIENAAPDAALSAQFNSWFTFFGQFFDHGLDLVDKGGNGTVFIPLMGDDPLVAGADGIFGNADDLPASQRFMVLTRATNTAVQAGEDGFFGTADDVHFHNNETTAFVDQNQTYTSHASHQVFLREYTLNGAGDPVATGRLIDGAEGGIANWAEVKAQAAQYLGIQLTDADVLDVPLLATDEYGKFIPGANGFAQFVTTTGLVEANPAANGGLGTLVPANALRSGHAFLNDIAHTAAPVFSAPGVLAPDADSDAGNPVATNAITGQPLEYDNELLNAHYITGDGRGNENIGLTAVHFVFHAEHNRLVGHTKDVVLASNDVSFINEWLLSPITALPTSQAEIDALAWNGERLFQAARFGTEMQYQHLVFEEFARKVQPQVDVFFAATQVYDTAINAAIVAEFAHVVYRFGHSMLTETIDRYDADFNIIADPNSADPNQQIGLIAAFLNPLEFAASGVTDAESAGAIIRGVTRQAGNEIDEFVTEALRNNLLGLPLDLPSINLARGRDTGVPSLNQARAEFYAMTGDSQLKPYTSWVDFGANIKHAESLINFIAAYGTHASIVAATTLLDKRAAAYALVYGAGGFDGDPGTLEDNPTVPVPADRLAFLTGPAATTGLDTVDLWIGGLAEKQMPFGGLLGSTFNFVFETQMEKLQDGDRFYYLERTAGMNFLTELENNSFAKLIMANTDVAHLAGDVFATPAFTLEVDQSRQYTGLGPDGRDDPINEEPGLIPLVQRSDPNDPLNPLYLEYNGADHVVLGGTDGNDTIISSEGDDTLYGDGGHDRFEGGDGNDFIFGGAGDDIITDSGGDDNLQGQDGNDAIHGGNGINLILGGFGNDFIVTGEDSSEVFGGPGNDFLLGVRPNEVYRGNEGDDWIEVGMVDGEAGDNFDPFGRDQIRGNDVFIGEGITDRMDGEGGDDIMVGNGGEGDRYEGFSGFDWAVFKDEPIGVTADLTLRAFDETPIPPSAASIGARFTSVEGLSGSAHGDFLRGDNNTAVEIAVSGAYGSVLENIDLIDGLQGLLDDLLAQPVTSFGAGNIILGGAGSDLIEGRGGDDLIDGDAWLNVRIGGVDVNGVSIGDNITSMTQIQARVFAGEINPGDLHIVREILNAPSEDFDTAIFSGALVDAAGNLNYTIAVNGLIVTDPTAGFTIADGDIVTVTDVNLVDGVDTLRNVERLQFTDQSLVINGDNQEPVGLLTIDDTTPTEDQLLTVSIAGVTDPDNPGTGAITGPVSYVWQQEVDDGVWEDIVVDNGITAELATGLTFAPGDLQVGLRLRVRAVYKDADGVLETVLSAPTAVVAGLNEAPVGALAISDATPTETQTITAIPQFTDPDGMTTAVLSYQWQQANNTGVGGGAGGFSDIIGGTSAQFTPGATQVNRELRVVVSYIDDQGFTNTVISAVTTVTGDFIPANNAAQVLLGTEGDDIILGGGGADLINANGGSDIIDGGTGDDLINAGAGNDTVNYTMGQGADAVNGDGGLDTLNVVGAGGNDALDVLFDGTVITQLEGGAITGVEIVNADLGANAAAGDTLTYDPAGAAVTTATVAVDLSLNQASGFGSIANIENVIGGSGNDLVIGNANANTLFGGGGNDIIAGGGANDAIDGDAGNDTFIATLNDGNDSYQGDAGTDTYNLAVTLAGAIITTASATSAEIGTDTLAGIENIVGSQGDDTITLNGGVNVIDGQGGNDTIAAGAGNDVVSGGAGNDTFNYTIGNGADTVDGGADSDTLNVTSGAGAQTLDVIFNGTSLTNFEGGTLTGVESVTADLGAATDTLTYAGTTADVSVNLTTNSASGFTSVSNIENLVGGSGNDTLTGNGGVNSLNGGAGNDTLDGGLGNDTLVGGIGDDTYIANAGDVITEGGGAGSGIDTVLTASNTFTLAGNVENLAFTGAGDFTGNGNGSNNTITGGIGNDTLNGGGGIDTLNGGDGHDTLDGGTGNDFLVGGGGNDTLNTITGNDTLMFAAGFGNDVVMNFDANAAGGQDLLDISAFGITALDFLARVAIIADANAPSGTLVTIDGDVGQTIKLAGITVATINQTDFQLA